MSIFEGDERSVPRRPFGAQIGGAESKLSDTVPIVGLGCSSFSTTFWSEEEIKLHDAADWRAETIQKDHPVVKKWVETIRYAVEICGINLLDTAPWYNTSEAVVGFALEEMKIKREYLTINTKLGRYYEAPPSQFDFSYEATVASAKRSLARMKCTYIDVLQLHDPEFSPSLDILLKETIPAMLECRSRGYCKALGLTGYPLKTQYLILQRSLELEPNSGKIWDQSLTYGHFNLANRSLLNQPMSQHPSFADFCKENKIGVMAAAPLGMGLFTTNTLPGWHPSPPELKAACSKAASICDSLGVDIVKLAILFALSESNIPCTILGMRNVAEVKFAHSLACQFHKVDYEKKSQDDILREVLTENEHKALKQLNDPNAGPFASVWAQKKFSWDGVEEAKKFWEQVDGVEQSDWQNA